MNTTIQDRLLVLGVGALLSALMLALWTPRQQAVEAVVFDAGYPDVLLTPPSNSDRGAAAPEAGHPVRFRAVRDAAGRLLEVTL